MFCENCGKEIPSESKFCKFCGTETVDDKTVAERETNNKEISIWDKFAEIYDSRDKEREIYNDLSSNEAWVLIGRLGKNSFESFIEENKSNLNNQPYKVLENLEDTIKFSVIGGYWLWMAEYILNNGSSWKLKPIVLDELIKNWTNNLKETGDFIQKIPQDLDNAFGIYQNFKTNSFLENSPSIKELPVEFIEKIKLEILSKILWGYFVGVSESKYIK